MGKIDSNVLIAAATIQDYCAKSYDDDMCTDCILKGKYMSTCPMPVDWDIPGPPPEPIERPRIEWARMLPDKELIMAMNNSTGCSKCVDEYDPNCYRRCADGVLPWWHKVVTFEQFREDVGLQ